MVRRGDEIWQYFYGQEDYHSPAKRKPEGNGVYRTVQRLDGFIDLLMTSGGCIRLIKHCVEGIDLGNGRVPTFAVAFAEHPDEILVQQRFGLLRRRLG